MKNEPIYRVQALERALDILDCFSFQQRELGLTEIAERTGLNKTTAKRLISNLTSRGYLQHVPDTKQYKLGLRLFELGGIVFSSFSLRKAAAYPMTQLQKRTAKVGKQKVTKDFPIRGLEPRVVTRPPLPDPKIPVSVNSPSPSR